MVTRIPLRLFALSAFCPHTFVRFGSVVCWSSAAGGRNFWAPRFLPPAAEPTNPGPFPGRPADTIFVPQAFPRTARKNPQPVRARAPPAAPGARGPGREFTVHKSRATLTPRGRVEVGRRSRVPTLGSCAAETHPRSGARLAWALPVRTPVPPVTERVTDALSFAVGGRGRGLPVLCYEFTWTRAFVVL